MAKPTQPRVHVPRMHAIHRKMSFEDFELKVPHRPGWKREYYSGRAHVRPSWLMVRFVLALARRVPPAVTGVRPLELSDETALHEAFFDAFRFAPDYCDYPLSHYRKRSREYIDGFYGKVRGEWSQASRVVTHRKRIIAGALIKRIKGKKPLLDCLFVRPDFRRQGLATAACTGAVNALVRGRHPALQSYVLLANEPSLAWHQRFGFEELPDLWVAQSRCFSAHRELDRLSKLGQLEDNERIRLEQVAHRWRQEMDRLEKLPFEQKHPRFDE